MSGSSSSTKARADEDDNKLPVVTIILQKEASSGTYKEFDCSATKKARDASAKAEAGQCRFAETSSGVSEAIWMTLHDWVHAASSGTRTIIEGSSP